MKSGFALALAGLAYAASFAVVANAALFTDVANAALFTGVANAALSARATNAAPFRGLRTPSHNITCVATGAALHCDIAQTSYRARLQERCSGPPTGLDWHGFDLTPRGRGEIACSGGALVMGPVRYMALAYGRTWRHGAYTCRSRRTGLTCTNRAGHGLFLSRASYRTF